MTRSSIVLAVAVFIGACSSSSSDNANASQSSDSGGAVLQAPMLMEVMPMLGALHLKWMNMQMDCDSVEAERKMQTDPFAVVFSVPGTVDNKMDETATDNMSYTFRMRCKKGSAYSVYSNEMSANPHDVDGGPQGDASSGLGDAADGGSPHQ